MRCSPRVPVSHDHNSVPVLITLVALISGVTGVASTLSVGGVGGDNFSTVETVLLDSPRLPKTVEKHPFLEMFLQNRLTVAWSYRVLSSKRSLDHGDTHHQGHTRSWPRVGQRKRSHRARAGGGGGEAVGGWGAEQGEGGLMRWVASGVLPSAQPIQKNNGL